MWNPAKREYVEVEGGFDVVDVITDAYGRETRVTVCIFCSDAFPDSRCERCRVSACSDCLPKHDCINTG